MKKSAKCSTYDMLIYSTGECTNSLISNAIWGFAMLYYTDALGLRPTLAGIAMSLSIFWDAVTDPVMGHISDHTRSRFGKRHPYILIGGLLMVLSFYLLWAVPDFFKSNNSILFWYLVGINISLRTFYTAFIIPYAALGFEMCTDYDGRAKLQGLRTVVNMIANLLGPALAWAIFFQNNGDIRAINVPKNYTDMAGCFSVISIFSIVLVVFSTLKHMEDSRGMFSGGGIKNFLTDIKEIVTDKYPRWVFIFIFIIMLAFVLVGSLQMYTAYD